MTKRKEGMQKYLNSLIRKHQKLDKQISGANQDTDDLREKKRLRLELKDLITRLQRGPEREIT